MTGTSAPTIRAPISLLWSKFAAPLLPQKLVGRERIVERIFLAIDAKAILVRAPAGFGKTTLMLELKERYERDGATTSWLHLDDADNDIDRFLACLHRALTPVLQTDADVTSEQPTPVGWYDQAVLLIEIIARAKSPFVLFLDEFESLKNPAVIGLIAQVLERLPRGVQVVIGTRSVPDIGLGRLRIRGHLLEVDPAELRLTAAETDVFLTQRHGLKLDPTQVHSLHVKTEGWITAISLAAVSLQRHDDRDSYIARFTGSNAVIADYLAEDVLAGLTDAVRDFLFDTCLLDTLSAALCDAVTGRSDSRERLAALDRANLFLIPLDQDRSEFRYHSLFVGFLRTRLKRQRPQSIPQLHRRAADWYLGELRPIPAIRHAIGTQDWPYASQLIAAQADQLIEQGRLRPLCLALDALPPEQLDSIPRLRVVHAWATLFTYGPHKALETINAVERSTVQSDEFEAHRLVLEPLRAGMLDLVEESYELAKSRQPRLNPEYSFPYRMSEQAMALTCMILGRHDEARLHAERARCAKPGEALGFSAHISEYVEAAIDLSQGRLKDAGARLRAAAGSNAAHLGSAFNRNAMPGLLLADILYESNELQVAEQLLGTYVPLVKNIGIADQLIVAHTLLSRVAVARGDADRALLILADLEATGHRLDLPRAVGSAHLERARQALAMDDTERARVELERVGPADQWARIDRLWFVANDVETLGVGKLRLQIRTGGCARAIDRLKLALEEAEKEGRNRRALKLRILLAEALHRSGQTKPASRMLARALEVGVGQGFIRSFLDEGAYIASMLRDVIATVNDTGDEQLAASLKSLAAAMQATPRPIAASAPSELAVPLTTKEIRVLELLAEGLSNNAIGDRMFVSESTVRAHLRSINAKLQASNRVQALVIARRLGVVR